MAINRDQRWGAHAVSMDPKARYPNGNQWDKVVVGKRLTDRKIEQYRQRGYYSAEFRAARKELMEKKRKRMEDRRMEDGKNGPKAGREPLGSHFWRADDGRLIYSPF